MTPTPDPLRADEEAIRQSYEETGHHPSCCEACDTCLRVCAGYHGSERRPMTPAPDPLPDPAVQRPSKRERRSAKREARWRASQRAEKEVTRRLLLALNRINVSAQSRGGIPAQMFHAVHYLERGWTGSFSPENDSRSVPREAPSFTLSHGEAEQLAAALDQMFRLARNADGTVEEVDP